MKTLKTDEQVRRLTAENDVLKRDNSRLTRELGELKTQYHSDVHGVPELAAKKAA